MTPFERGRRSNWSGQAEVRHAAGGRERGLDQGGSGDAHGRAAPPRLDAGLPCRRGPRAGGAPARVRLLGENLVAYRDSSGRVGLLQENCPHRGASLYFGRNEGAALRCAYHGWAFDADGRCVDMPSEPQPFCDKVRMRAYPTHESGGIVWAYLGPGRR